MSVIMLNVVMLNVAAPESLVGRQIEYVKNFQHDQTDETSTDTDRPVGKVLKHFLAVIY
jgi:hypothetical protein